MFGGSAGAAGGIADGQTAHPLALRQHPPLSEHRTLSPKTQNPKLETQKLKPQIPNLKTQNPKPKSKNSKPTTPNPKTPNRKPKT